jgi:hypothetical protein
MPMFDSSTDSRPSALWRWGFWICVAVAVAAFLISRYTPAPIDRVLLGVAGVLFIVGGVHQSRVVAYKRATRGPYRTYGPDSYLIQRQTGWSAVVLGLVLLASAVIGL